MTTTVARLRRPASLVPALAERTRRVPTPVWLLVAMVGIYVAVFGVLTAEKHANFGTFGFDMGVYDQGIWLLSRFHNPFITVRGLNFYADHFTPITVLYVPFYWLGAGPVFLSVSQALGMALGAVPVWLLARDRSRNQWLALGVAAAFLLHPSLQWITHFEFHPEALAATPLMFAYWLVMREQPRWGWYWVALVAAMACKESVPLTVIALGVLVAWRVDRRQGLLTMGAAVAWFLIATRVVMVAFNDGSVPHYTTFYAQWGDSPLSIATSILTNPMKVLDLLTDGDRVDYYIQMLAPLAFLPLAAVGTLFVAVPQVLVNVLSNHGPTYEIEFQYSTLVIAGFFLAACEALGRRHVTMGGRRFLVGLMVAAALASNVAWSPSPLSVKYDTGIWPREARPIHAHYNAALDLIPDGAGVSATYLLVPQLTHRRHVYEWPNPFVAANWGFPGEPSHPEERAEYLLIDTAISTDHPDVLERLLRTDYEVIYELESLILARRE